MTVTTLQMREGQVYSLGQKLDWKEQIGSEGVPGLSGEGVTIGRKTVIAAYAIQPRINIAYKTVKFRVDALNIGDNITYSIDGAVATSYVVGSTDMDLELASLTDSITSSLSSDVTASYEGSEVVVTGNTSDSYTFSITFEDDNEGEVTHEDADSCDFRIYLRPPLSSSNNRWNLVNGGQGSVEFRGLTDRLITSGYDQMYIEVYNKDDASKNVTVFIAPASL